MRRRNDANIVCFLRTENHAKRLDEPKFPVFVCLARNMLKMKHQHRSNDMAFTEKDMQAQEEQLNALKDELSRLNQKFDAQLKGMGLTEEVELIQFLHLSGYM